MEEIFNHNWAFASHDTKFVVNDHLVKETCLFLILEGEFQVRSNEGFKIYESGQIGLIKQDVMLKSKRIPGNTSKLFSGVAVYFPSEMIVSFARNNAISVNEPYYGAAMLKLNSEKVKSSLIDLKDKIVGSVSMSQQENDQITMDLLQQLILEDPSTKGLIFDLTKKSKLDLEAFMNKHFEYNISIGDFAKLTGRSLSTFKREFKRVFEDSPEKWLKEKRLVKAHYMIKELKMKPSEIYPEVGFENFSHFSTAFKKRFGYSPSSLLQ